MVNILLDLQDTESGLHTGTISPGPQLHILIYQIQYPYGIRHVKRVVIKFFRQTF
ncbi:hypothetical protein D3C80_1684010 [compost metagenome]